MLEGRRRFFIGHRQADPALDAVHAVAAGTHRIAGAFAMGNAASRRHPVDVAGLDLLHCAQGVAVHLRAIEQVGDGGQADMGMRAHIDALAGREIDRPEIVEEDERSDAAPRNLRQQAGDEKSVAQVVCFSGDGDHGASLAARAQKL